MDQRLYFILGDLLANIVVGAVVAAVSWKLLDPAWNMYLASILMMALGMIVAMMAALPFIYFFGAMEVMLPAMTTGMISGMVTGMWLSMEPISFSLALVIGGVCGLACIVAMWVLNSQISGIQTRQVSRT